MAGWEWEVEGKKGLLGMEVKKVLAKGKAFGLWKWEIFENSEEGLVQKKSFCLRKKLPFSAHAKPTDKEKFFLSIHELQLSTAPKLTCSNKFHL